MGIAWRHYYLIVLLTVIFCCAGCLNVSRKLTNNEVDSQSLSILPPELQKEHISLDEILSNYDNLDDKQRGIALERFLSQANLSDVEQAEAAYIFGRILQRMPDQYEGKSPDKKRCETSFALFTKAKSYPPLKINSLRHIIEVATVYGEEKIVRRALNEVLAETNDPDIIAAAQYGLAQSYLRANETDKAEAAFKKIRADFPTTNYALGSAYYLGTLGYWQFERAYKNSKPEAEKGIKVINYRSELKTVLSYYLEYLQASPLGHFAQDILAKLQLLDKPDNNLLKPPELAIVANVYFLNGQYKIALSYWQRAGEDKYSFEIANCLAKQGQVQAAEKKLLQLIDKYRTDRRCLSLAEALSAQLSKQETFRLWEKLYKAKVCGQDEIIWNLAIRSTLPQCLSYYQRLICYYPASIYAPEAQWRIFWQRIKQSKGKPLAVVGNWCCAAANKYNHSKLAPRFMFWAGKLNEIVSNKQQALIYYQQAQDRYKSDYYGQRARARYAAISNGQRDNYFELQSPIRDISQGWDWPVPKTATENLKKESATIHELVHLKQYDEVLAQYRDLSTEIVLWLKGKTKQPAAAINIAAKWLDRHKADVDTCKLADDNLFWQYSYPLLYDKEITTHCRESGIVDPLFLHALIREESRYESQAISSAKALGLCQLMPSTAISVAKSQGINILDTNQLYDPDLNTKLGSLYLSWLLKSFNGNGLFAIASYNAGTGAIQYQLKNKQPPLIADPDYFVEDFPYRETRDYIRRVFSSYYLYREIYH